jgi:hypothetical protein
MYNYKPRLLAFVCCRGRCWLDLFFWLNFENACSYVNAFPSHSLAPNLKNQEFPAFIFIPKKVFASSNPPCLSLDSFQNFFSWCNKVKVKFTLEQAAKVQTWSIGIALLFL